MKKIINLFVCVVLVAFLCMPPVSLGSDSASSPDASSFASYGSYEEKDEAFIPSRISPVKLVTFPIMAVAVPVVFPGYYIYTKEPKLKQSFTNYWRWIYYKVSYDTKSIVDQELTFPRPSKVKTKRYKKRKPIQKKKGTYLPEDKEVRGKIKATHKSKKQALRKRKQESNKTKEKTERYAEKIVVLLKQGEEQCQKKDYKDATRTYKKVLKYNSENKHAQRMIKIISGLQKSQKRKRVSVRKDKKHRHEEKVQMLLRRGEEQCKKENYKGALRFYKKVLTYDSDNEKAQNMIQVISKTLESPQHKPIREQKVKEKSPAEKIQMLLKQGDEQYQKKNYKDAAQFYKDVLTYDVDNKRAQRMIIIISGIELSQKYKEAVVSSKPPTEKVK
ncbi:MAG: hypothetical protein KKH94_10325 [Candidatus Omnitrophica bacterium]|nr:hypothetical protein [Candidatus Omnitrophota bacterium]